LKTKELLDDLVGTTTDLSVLLREVCIVVLFCLLFFAPDTFKTLLTRIGISKVSTVFGDIDVTQAGGTVATLNRGLKDSIDRLQQIQSTSSDPQAKTDVGKVTDYLKGLQQEADVADQTIKTTLVAQQAVTEQASPQSVKKSGWVFAGNYDKDKVHWASDSLIPTNLPTALTVNQQFGVTNTAYLRDNYQKGNVIGVVRKGAQVKVTAAPVCSTAITGGAFCWVQIQPL